MEAKVLVPLIILLIAEVSNNNNNMDHVNPVTLSFIMVKGGLVIRELVLSQLNLLFFKYV